jgi:hypothetical protein
MRAKLIISGVGLLGFVFIATVGFYMVREAGLWRDLAEKVPAASVERTKARYTMDDVFVYPSDGTDEVGYVELASGDVWRFAFRSHHRLNRFDSYSVFSGPLGTYRVRGDYFCCEVQFRREEMPKDSASFLAFLRSSHPFVAQVQ